MSIDEMIKQAVAEAIHNEMIAIKPLLLRKEVYTLEEAADLLKVNPATLRRECEKGRCKSFTIGNRLRIANNELENYMNNSTNNH